MTWMTPWMIGGGVSHEVEVARLLAYASTGGAEGIVTPGDLKVRPLSTPGGKIRVAPGAALMLNRFPGGTGQTYVGRLPAQEEVAVTATGSAGGRTDLVVARIHDPQYAGPVPPDVQEFSYARTEIIESVPAGTTSTRDLNLSYPAVALARIDLPNNTGTVEASHVTDVREIAQPRRAMELRTYRLNTGDEDRLNAMTSDGEVWPNAAVLAWDPGIWVPEWATRVRIVCTWSGILQPSGYARGNGWVQVGPTPDGVRTASTRWQSADASSASRDVHVVADDIKVLAAHRGTYQRFYPKAYVADGTAAARRPTLQDASSVVLQVDFYETAV